jgi:hypothetical protein
MGTPEDPTPGDLHINADAIKTVKFATDYLNSFTKLREGFEDAVTNLEKLAPEQRKMAGISAEQVAELVELAADHKKIAAFYAASAEMTELLRHTYLDRSHKIATRIAEATEQVRRRADRSPNGAEILGSLADMIEYQLGPAQKAMATKAKAKVAAKKGDEPAKGSIETTP